MAISKITLNGATQMDVTDDTVVPNHLLAGDTATGANGEHLMGTLQVDVVVDPTLSNEGEAADAKVTGDKLNDINNATTNRLFITDFGTNSAISKSIDANTGEITLSNLSTGTYIGVSTANTWGARLIPGQKYRVHAQAVAVSGSPQLVVAVRGTSAGENVIAAYMTLTNTQEGYVDFIATEYVKKVTLFVAYTNASQNSVSKFWNLWVRAIDRDTPPIPPATNGTYNLRCVVSGGVPSYSWVSV